MKHTKKIVGLILALACVFSMFTVTASATKENAPWYSEAYDGTYTLDFNRTGMGVAGIISDFFKEVKDVTLKFDKSDIEISFNAVVPGALGRVYVKETILDGFNETNWYRPWVDGQKYTYRIKRTINNQYFDFDIVKVGAEDFKINFWFYSNLDIAAHSKFWPTGIYLKKEETPVEPPVEPFTFKQSVFSNLTTPKGEYELNISAFMHTIVNDGVNALTLEEIKKQYITIQAINTVTGEYRVMDQNTIEGIQITAADGKATEITINGRVQTKNGKLERYVTTITL